MEMKANKLVPDISNEWQISQGDSSLMESVAVLLMKKLCIPGLCHAQVESLS